jgi:hypothetical protein
MFSMEFFNQLSLEDQADYLWQYGSRITSKKFKEHFIILYSLGNYFTEVWSHSEADHIILITSFKAHSTQLDEYLEKYTLHELFAKI